MVSIGYRQLKSTYTMTIAPRRRHGEPDCGRSALLDRLQLTRPDDRRWPGRGVGGWIRGHWAWRASGPIPVWH